MNRLTIGNRRVERVFVLRIWREAGAGNDALRGNVEEVGSRVHFAFTELSDLDGFLRQRLEARES